MNKDEILKELGMLMELTNDQGKGMIRRICNALNELPKPIQDRRQELRDEGEADQHKAEDLGFVSAPKHVKHG